MALTTLQSINAEIRQLEAQKKLVAQRDAEMPKALEVLQRFAKVLTPVQRRKIAKIIGETIDTTPARTRGAAKKGRKRAKVAPKFRLPTGEPWTGRGRPPVAFVAWEHSAEGKAWSRANDGARFPPATGAAPTAPAKKAAKTRRKAAGTRVAKAGKQAARKGAAKKTARKHTARKATKKARQRAS